MDNVTLRTDGNIAGVMIIPHGIFSLIATVFVGLRLYTARVVTKSDWAFDDCVCVVALLANHLMLITEGVAAHFGMGRDTNVVQTLPGGISALLKGIKGIELTYGTACALSKLAVLTMYYRIFSASPVLRSCVWIIGSMIGGWGIAVVGVSIFSCTPIQGFWDHSIPSKCIDPSKFYIGITAGNIVFDVLTVALPVYEVWRLQMGREKKLAVTGIFLLGGSVVLASFARLILFTIYRPGGGESGNNFSQTVVIPHAASAIETCLAIIAACLPPCAPLLRRLIGDAPGIMLRRLGPAKPGNESKNFSTLITIGKISNRSGGNPKRADYDLDGSFVRLEDGSVEGSMDNLHSNARGAQDNESHDVEYTIHPRRIDQTESRAIATPIT